MIVQYDGPSEVRADGAIHLSPNLRRERVELRAVLRHPLPFRDAMLALRDCIHSRLFVSVDEIIAAQLDPVVTVTPDGVHFEAFSQDESTYGRVAVRPEALEGLTSSSFGCTNVEFSEALARGLRALRSTAPAVLEVGRASLAVGEVREAKIDLPRSWLQGFLEVQAAQRLPGTWLQLHPVDLANVLNYLRKRKEQDSPRSLRFALRPGAPPRVTVEPWDHVVEMRRSTHDASSETEVRVWGRRRLLLLAGVLPQARRVRVLLPGSGRPSFWVAELPGVSFLLGLSPWCAREWTVAEACAPFALPAPVTADEVDRVAAWLEERMTASVEDLGAVLAGPRLRSALDRLCRQGRALYDLETGRYLARRLLDEAVGEPPALGRRQAEALKLRDRVRVQPSGEGWAGFVKDYPVQFRLGPSGEIAEGACGCGRFSLGPCKHLLAAQGVVTS